MADGSFRTNDEDRRVEARWSPTLAKGGWSPVPSFFLKNYHRLKPEGMPDARGLNSTEAMLILQICDFKWTTEAPFPKVSTLAKHLGIKERQVRQSLKNLEELKLVRREPKYTGGPNQYFFEGLLERLHRMMQDDGLVPPDDYGLHKVVYVDGQKATVVDYEDSETIIVAFDGKPNKRYRLKTDKVETEDLFADLPF